MNSKQSHASSTTPPSALSMTAMVSRPSPLAEEFVPSFGAEGPTSQPSILQKPHGRQSSPPVPPPPSLQGPIPLEQQELNQSGSELLNHHQSFPALRDMQNSQSFTEGRDKHIHAAHLNQAQPSHGGHTAHYLDPQIHHTGNAVSRRGVGTNSHSIDLPPDAPRHDQPSQSLHLGFPPPLPGRKTHETHNHGESALHRPNYRYGTMSGGVDRPYDLYASPHLRENARADIAAMLRASPKPQSSIVPEFVNQYYNLVALESHPSSILHGSPSRSLTYRAVSSESGECVVLRRILGPPPAHSEQIIRSAEIWKKIVHPGLVSLYEVFTTRSFTSMPGSSLPTTNELIIVYEHCPRAETLHGIFLGSGQLHPLGESTMWAITTQLLAATAAVHDAGLCMRSALSSTSILVTGRNRVRVNRIGLNDMVDPEGIDHLPSQVFVPSGAGGGSSAFGGGSLVSVSLGGTGSIANGARVVALQKDDLANIGRILMALASRSQSPQARAGIAALGGRTALEYLQKSGTYSADFLQVIAVLLGASMPGSRVVIRDILSMVGPRLAAEMSNVWTHADSVHQQLIRECDASRLFRLIALLGFVNERHGDSVGDAHWAETGDRYLLKLFRDYVFHQVDENGQPNLNLAHVVESLNRMDVGSPEQILLSSRDGASLIVASYEDVRRCLMQAVGELKQHAHT